MSRPPRSESPDDYLKRNGLDGFDRQLASKDVRPTLDKGKIGALRQPKDTVSDGECNDCN